MLTKWAVKLAAGLAFIGALVLAFFGWRRYERGQGAAEVKAQATETAARVRRRVGAKLAKAEAKPQEAPDEKGRTDFSSRW